jgi:hypothetical protein
MLRTARSLPQKGFRRWASTRPVSRPSRQPATGPPDSYPDRTHTGRRRRAYVGSATQFSTSNDWAHSEDLCRHDGPPVVQTMLAERTSTDLAPPLTRLSDLSHSSSRDPADPSRDNRDRGERELTRHRGWPVT